MDEIILIKDIPAKTIDGFLNDPEKTAAVIDLVYVSDSMPGISRKKRGRNFSYYLDEKKIVDKKDIQRIKALAIPPAWENVWICSLEKGHLQATGIDSKKRKQYRYHSGWNAFRNQTKFYRLPQFGKALSRIRAQVDKDLSLPGMPQEKVLAVIVSLMQHTHIRIGSQFYEKLYGSFGLTTLKNRHVDVNGAILKFSFTGKKGIRHDISIRSKRLARIVQQAKDIPGKELFQYYAENGDKHTIDSGMVNEYIRRCCEEEFTAKDFRTWSGTLHAFVALKESPPAENETEVKKNILSALDHVAAKLGNTRAVCRKYYVHPQLLSLYENKKQDIFLRLKEMVAIKDNEALEPDERAMLSLLKK